MGAVATVAAALLLIVSLFVGLDNSSAAADGSSSDTITTCTVDGVPTVPGLADDPSVRAEQLANVQVILTVGTQLNVPKFGLEVALAVARQESNIRNLDSGDRDSLGMFQQRAPWGSAADRMDPVKSTTMFFNGGHGGQNGLLDIAGWQQMPLWQAAQAVQVSGFPYAYQQWQPLAEALAAGVTCTAPPGNPGTGLWRDPMTPGTYTKSSPFGPRWGRLHAGQDMAAPCGTPIYAAAAGTVTLSGLTDPGGYGAAVYIDHGNGLITRYGHVLTWTKAVGATVNAGDLIGTVGERGDSTGCHLHFETRPGNIPVDPVPFMAARGVTL